MTHETIEEAAERCFKEMQRLNPKGGLKEFIRMAVNFGAKWQAERMYSEEDMRDCWKAAYKESFNKWVINKSKTTFKKWLTLFKNQTP